MKQFISVKDAPGIDTLIDRALAYKANPFSDRTLGKDKRIGLLFFNPSLRTRISTQVAAQQLGMEAVVFNAGTEGWALEFADDAVMNGSTVEHVKDAAPVLGTYFDLLCIRTFPSLQDRTKDYSEQVLQQFIRYAGIPVISLESATLHPLQSLADMITIREHMVGRKPKVVLTWAPHIKATPQCVANSFSQWANAWDQVKLTVTCPEGYQLDETFTTGATVTTDQEAALQDADFVYVKNWSSYRDYGKVLPVMEDWMLTEERLKHAPAAKIMHCLPVRRELELSGALLDSNRSLVTEQAANRVWSAQAVLASILKAL
ncbi:Rossmann-fold NAD(P)-binding domain-containing protein [Taibaiella koreensis]|uniref:acetylornithine carbamoyltransferase n=1 Tax=Taibaiella koreensis TaxID=1268548 RepID=UPI000E59BAC7|nr:acetylornithine carbamoyltransferase [Taibaiella koreensis]